MELCFSRRAEDLDHHFIDSGAGASLRIILTCTIPLSEIVTDFFDQLKSRSSGFASFEWVFQVFYTLQSDLTFPSQL
jgi:translation elongation factor EF-4